VAADGVGVAAVTASLDTSPAASSRPGRLRIAIQIERFDPRGGGAEAYAARLAKGLVALGDEVTVITSEAADSIEGVRVVRVPGPRHPKFLRALAFARGSAAAVRAGGYDIVHALGKSLGMNILNPHGGVESIWLEQERRSHPPGLSRAWWTFKRYLSPRHYVIQAVIARQYRHPGVLRFVALSPAIKEAMTRVHGIAPAMISVLPNGVDTARFRPAVDVAERSVVAARLGLPSGTLIFLFVANNFRLKGLRPLLEALGWAAKERPAPPAFLLVVLGRGDAERYRRIAAGFGIGDRVEFRGPVTGIEEWYRAADGYFHPSFFDACSLSLPEAMASGLPVLASRHDGSSELVESDRNGYMIDDPENLGELHEGLRLFFDAGWRHQMGAAARACLLKRPAPGPAAAMRGIYLEALAATPAAGRTGDKPQTAQRKTEDANRPGL